VGKTGGGRGPTSGVDILGKGGKFYQKKKVKESQGEWEVKKKTKNEDGFEKGVEGESSDCWGRPQVEGGKFRELSRTRGAMDGESWYRRGPSKGRTETKGKKRNGGCWTNVIGKGFVKGKRGDESPRWCKGLGGKKQQRHRKKGGNQLLGCMLSSIKSSRGSEEKKTRVEKDPRYQN